MSRRISRHLDPAHGHGRGAPGESPSSRSSPETSAASSHRSTTCCPSTSRRPSSNPTSAASSTTGAGRRRERVPLGPHPGLPTADPARVQLGHQSLLADRNRAPTGPARSRSGLHRRVTVGDPGYKLKSTTTWSETATDGKGSTTESTTTRVGPLPHPLRRAVRGRGLSRGTVETDRHRPDPADGVFAYVTDPGRFNQWQDGVVSGQWWTPRSTAALT